MGNLEISKELLEKCAKQSDCDDFIVFKFCFRYFCGSYEQFQVTWLNFHRNCWVFASKWLFASWFWSDKNELLCNYGAEIAIVFSFQNLLWRQNCITFIYGFYVTLGTIQKNCCIFQCWKLIGSKILQIWWKMAKLYWKNYFYCFGCMVAEVLTNDAGKNNVRRFLSIVSRINHL